MYQASRDRQCADQPTPELAAETSQHKSSYSLT